MSEEHEGNEDTTNHDGKVKSSWSQQGGVGSVLTHTQTTPPPQFNLFRLRTEQCLSTFFFSIHLSTWL